MSSESFYENIYDSVEHIEFMDSNLYSPDCEEIVNIHERYIDYKLIGFGGLKKVYKVYDLITQRYIAIALPRQGLPLPFYDIVIREARITASLSHANIIKVNDIGISNDKQPFFTMDLKKGLSLDSWLKDNSNPTINTILDIFIKVCDAISYAHSKGVLHLDLKPENIQIESYGEVIVCDWGLGCIDKSISNEKGSIDDENKGITLHGIGRGSPGFMAPEQLEPQDSFNTRTDVYGLGALLYYLLTQRPHVEDYRNESNLKLEHPSSIKTLKTPRALGDIAIKALSMDPINRYESVSLLKNDIIKFQNNLPTYQQSKSILTCFWLAYIRNQFFYNMILVMSIFTFVSITWTSKKVQNVIHYHKKEKTRADDAVKKAQLIMNKFDTLKNRESQKKEEQLNRLNKHIDDIKTELIFKNPIETINAVKGLCKLALSIDQENKLALHHLSDMKILQLNTVASKKILLQHDINYYNTKDFVVSSPNTNFNTIQRPSIYELIDFIYNVHFHSLTSAKQIERILSYDYHLRFKKEKSQHIQGYDKVLEAYMSWWYSDWSNKEFIYLPNEQTLIIGGTGYGGLALPPPGGSGTTPLRFLPIRKLKLNGHPNNIKDFSSLKISTLDLSEANNIHLNHILEFKDLSTLIVRKHQFKQDRLDELPEQIIIVYK